MTKKRKNSWTDAELAFVKENFPTKDINYISDHLKKSHSAIRGIAYKLGLKRKNRRWTIDQENYLLKNADVLTYIKIAEHLGKTRSSVINKYRQLTKNNYLQRPSSLLLDEFSVL